MTKTLDEIWKEAELTGEVDLGDRVFCDYCGKEWTGKDDSGGLLFGSKAVCPECAPNAMVSIKKYHEEKFIKATCPPDQSYWKWTLSLRGGDNKIKTYIIEKQEG